MPSYLPERFGAILSFLPFSLEPDGECIYYKGGMKLSSHRGDQEGVVRIETSGLAWRFRIS